MSRKAVLIAGLVIASAHAGAQVPNGPPIAPDQVLRQQNAPLPPPPSLPVPATPTPASPPSYAPPRGALPPEVERDRVTACQHQAAVERVPRRRRGSYIHNCVMN